MHPVYLYIILNFNRFCSGGNQAAVGSKSEKAAVAKKDDSNYAAHSTRGNTVPVNRAERKPQINAQQITSKPMVSQSVVSAKPVGVGGGGGVAKPTSHPSQTQQPVSVKKM